MFQFSDGAIVAVCSGIGAYIGAYLKKKGENYATKEDVDIVVQQIAAVTATAKRIEGNIAHDYRRWEVKKEVLFELLEKYGVVDDALNRLIAATGAPIFAPDEKGSGPNATAVAFTNVNREFMVAAMKVKVTCGHELVDQVMKTGSMISLAASYAANGQFQEAQTMFDEMRKGLKKLNELVTAELESLSNQ